MKYLSVRYYGYLGKTLLLLLLIMAYVIIGYILINSIFGSKEQYSSNILSILILFLVFFEVIRDSYLFLLSKEVKYNKEYLYIRLKKNWIEIPINCVINMNHYFFMNKYCKITIKDNDLFKNGIVYQNSFTISTNGSKKKIEEVLSYSQKLQAKQRDIEEISSP
jgi:hypothetical protein